MRAGAADFLEKSAASEHLLAAIECALAADATAHDARARTVELRRRFSLLTPREHEVLEQVVNGGMNKQIAARLGIHERTVKLHRTSITTKVGVHSSAQLATLARDAHVFD
jgi:FixJ family two-component response regulator